MKDCRVVKSVTGKWTCLKCGYQWSKPYEKAPKRNCSHRGLGDYVAAALAFFGITKRRVSRILGRDCGCSGKQEVLNELGEKLGL